jgi:DNA helicase IV
MRDALVAQQRVAIERVRLAKRAADFDARAKEVVAWSHAFRESAAAHRGWMSKEFTHYWLASRPDGGFAQYLNDPDLAAHRESRPPELAEAVSHWSSDIEQWIGRRNSEFAATEAAVHASFFDNVERSPLTAEQTHAVICFDNRVQLIASAGSGKTSTMIAKAGYAIYRDFVPAQRILMLAFNTKAAEELRDRISERLNPLGLAADRIAAKTFHAFGLEVIGAATGRKPRVAPWLEHSGGDIEMLGRIIDELRDHNITFRSQWDLFRVVLSRDLPDFGKEQDEPDGWDPVARTDGFRTLAGEVVRSQGERLIADWLFYNGVQYRYEGPYAIDTADAAHRQYLPDFYYPDVDLYHEHLALDAAGQPPAEFVGYLEGVAWKRSLHAHHGTALIETTMAGLWHGDAFAYLAEQLTARGIELDPDPERPAPGYQPIDNERLIKTVRSFMIHAKSNRLSDDELAARVHTESHDRFTFRHHMFVQLYRAIRDRWEEKLRENDSVDFEDMLNLAADYVEEGRWVSPYQLVMVDEMQDASAARARLARALVNAPERFLFAVGDDWQSINRFAGADLAVMTKFEQWFGHGTVLRLERTFRCPQSLCTISSGFVSKNPSQLSKRVLSSTPEYPPSVSAISAAREEEVPAALVARLDALDREAGPARGRVFILGRYRHHEALVPPGAAKRWPQLDVRFSTIHASKGLEADYVIILGLVRDKSAFPSRTADDPVLRLAMPTGEPFPHAEERRLLYVALTRARRSVTLVTVQHRESPFLRELVSDHAIPVTTTKGDATSIVNCPECADGVMVPRIGPRGTFYGCSNFPRCRHTMHTLP